LIPFNGVFEMVDPKAIVIDHNYQRPEKETLVAQIAKEFNWASFGTISCYKRNGMYYAVDGQQRLKSALSLAEVPAEVPCVVFPEATAREEAGTFLDIQINRKAVSAFEKHKAELVARVPSALAIQRAVEHVGFNISAGDYNPNSVYAIRTLHYVYTLLGEEGVVQTLTQVRDAWPGDPTAVRTQILKGVADIIAEKGDKYDRAAMTKALKRTTPSDILRQARAHKFNMGGSVQVNIRRAFKTNAKI
jgi:hypothetical protein